MDNAPNYLIWCVTQKRFYYIIFLILIHCAWPGWRNSKLMKFDSGLLWKSERRSLLEKKCLEAKTRNPKSLFSKPGGVYLFNYFFFSKVNRPYLAQKNDFPKSLFFPPLKTKFYIFEHKYMCARKFWDIFLSEVA